MELNGKALEHFETWLESRDNFLFGGTDFILTWEDLDSSVLRDYIIDWLDCVGFHLSIRFSDDKDIEPFYCTITQRYVEGMTTLNSFATRNQAWNYAFGICALNYNRLCK